jgi:hypothetical protein
MKVNQAMFRFLQDFVEDGELYAWKWVQPSKVSNHILTSHFDGAETLPSRVEIKKAPIAATIEAS